MKADRLVIMKKPAYSISCPEVALRPDILQGVFLKSLMKLKKVNETVAPETTRATRRKNYFWLEIIDRRQGLIRKVLTQHSSQRNTS